MYLEHAKVHILKGIMYNFANGTTFSLGGPFSGVLLYLGLFQVNVNGLISFGYQEDGFIPEPFPLRDRPMVASFWADADITYLDGTVFYRGTAGTLSL